MQDNTLKAIIHLSWMFRQICKKVVNPNEMTKLNVVITLCMLEMEMPPAFLMLWPILFCIWLKSSIYVA
jgi:hypothetical protein